MTKMQWSISTFVVLLCTFLKAESLLFHGQTNATSTSNGHSDLDVYKQLLHLETVLNSIMLDQKQQAQQFAQQQKLLEGEIQTAKMKITVLEDSLLDVQSENKILKEKLDNLNSSSTSSQNLTTSKDLKKLENTLTFEIEQMIREKEQKMMKNMSATIKDLELRDRYLSLSLLDIHNNTAGLSSSLSSLEQQQTMMKSEIQTLSNSQQNNIAKLNDTIIHLKNRVQSNVAFTAGILGETSDQRYANGDTVKFPRVIYQEGGGYNPTTGVFTAPKAGLYLIFCTNVARPHETFWTAIMINGSFKAGVMAYFGMSNLYVHQSASNLVVHRLQVGDRVWIQVYSGSRLFSVLSETTFSVVMINGSD